MERVDKEKRGMNKDEKTETEDEQRGLTAVDILGALVDGEQQVKKEKRVKIEGGQGEERHGQR